MSDALTQGKVATCPSCAGTSTPQTEALLADEYCPKHMRPWPIHTAFAQGHAGKAVSAALLAGHTLKVHMHVCSDGSVLPMVTLADAD